MKKVEKLGEAKATTLRRVRHPRLVGGLYALTAKDSEESGKATRSEGDECDTRVLLVGFIR